MALFTIDASFVDHVDAHWDLYEKHPYALNLKWMEQTHQLSRLTDWPIISKREGLHRMVVYIVRSEAFALVFKSDSLTVHHYKVVRRAGNRRGTVYEVSNEQLLTFVDKMKKIGMIHGNAEIIFQSIPLFSGLMLANRTILDASRDAMRSHFFVRSDSLADAKLLGDRLRQDPNKNTYERKIIPMGVPNQNSTQVNLRGMKNPVAHYSTADAVVEFEDIGSIPLLAIPTIFSDHSGLNGIKEITTFLPYTSPNTFFFSKHMLTTLVPNHTPLLVEFLKVLFNAYTSFDPTGVIMQVANSDFLAKLSPYQIERLYVDVHELCGSLV